MPKTTTSSRNVKTRADAARKPVTRAATKRAAAKSVRKSAPAPPAAALPDATAARDAVGELASGLGQLGQQLSESTQVTTRLLDLLHDLPAAVAANALATRTLADLGDRLERAHAQLQDAVFHLPRASEYEPLVEPLRQFARLSPRLTAALEGTPGLASELAAAIHRIEAAGERIAAGTAVGPSLAPAPKGLLAVRLERIAQALALARDTIRGALASLPQSADYAPVARQLKELASVSPSLLEWLRELPRLSAPLGDSVTALDAAADALDGAFVDVELTRRDLSTTAENE
jgi:hypothetical protein